MENGDILLQLGVGATVAILMVREVLSFLKSKNGANGRTTYVEWERWRAVEDAIRAHTQSVKNNTEVLTRLSHHLEEMRRELTEVKQGLEK